MDVCNFNLTEHKKIVQNFIENKISNLDHEILSSCIDESNKKFSNF